MRKTFDKTLAGCSAFTLAIALAGCAADAGPPDASEEAVQTVTQGERAEGRRPHHPPGGPEFLLVAALHELDLDDAQERTIEVALGDLDATRRTQGPPDGAFFAALAKRVRAGKIDTAALMATPAPTGADAHRAAVASALAKLHATLTKEQRRELVDAVAARMDGQKGEGKPPMDAQGPPPGEHPGGPEGRGPRGPLGGMLHDLELTDAQRQAIDRALEAQHPNAAGREARDKEHSAMRAAMKTKLESFAADAFDANAFAAPPKGDSGVGPRRHREHMVEALAAIVPILEPAQRDALATRIEQGPPAPPAGPRRQAR